MPQFIPDKLTPVTVKDLWNALVLRWETIGRPNRKAIELKLAHIWLETGLKSCHCWNLGNIKRIARLDWTQFACGEEVPAELASKQLAKYPALVEVRSRYQRAGKPFCSLWLKPPHPWTEFAAFPDLQAGAEEQLGYLARHPSVLRALETGDPLTYCQALSEAEYFTASPQSYSVGLANLLKQVRCVTKDYNWGDVV